MMQSATEAVSHKRRSPTKAAPHPVVSMNPVTAQD